IKRVQANLKKLNLPKNSLLYNAPIFVVSAISSLATNNLGWASVGIVLMGFSIPLIVVKSLRTTVRIQSDINFLSENLQSINSVGVGRDMNRIRSKYNFFYVNPKTNGVILTNILHGNIKKALGTLKGGNICIFDKNTGKIFYKGVDRRWSRLDRRSSQRRSDERKETFRW
ncbi:MAG: hypothetical protein HYW50_03030, partial [Candidatus Diapherotrites archaeon]|nr:hypothetical protein [Candidatus Diapherotrites archaeon]